MSAEGSLKSDLMVYVGILALAGAQIFLAYYSPGVIRMLLVAAIQAFFAVMFFMHLRFDNRIFSVLFYMGLGLAIFVYIVALSTFHFFGS